MAEKFKNFSGFYTYYLTQHKKKWTRIGHFVAIFLIVAVILYVLQSGKERFLWYIPIFGFGLPGLSHAIFERNRPTFFRYPFWTIVADFRLFYDLMTKKEKLS